jgi:hypothetical protein
MIEIYPTEAEMLLVNNILTISVPIFKETKNGAEGKETERK